METVHSPKTDLKHGTENHLPYWRSGSGHYGDTLGQISRQIVSSRTDLVLSLLDTVPVDPSGVFTIADYGANDGYASLTLIGDMIGHLRKRHGEGLQIQVIYEDQEKNDFNSLFKWLTDDTSYMSKFSNVYPFATNVNFYRQCVPAATCDVIFTSLAAQWLDNPDVDFKECLFHFSAAEGGRDRLFTKAEQDWTTFVALRAKELKPGGLFVALNLCSRTPQLAGQGENSHGASEPGEVVHPKLDVHLDLERAWEQLKLDRRITVEEYERCTFREAFRTAQQCKLPFETDGSAVSQSGLRLLHYEEFVGPSIPKKDCKNADTKETRAAFADKVVTANRVWSHTTFLSSLSAMRPEPEKAVILDELFQKFHALVMTQRPETYRCEELVSSLVAQKM